MRILDCRVFKPYWDLQHRIIRSGLDEVFLVENKFLFLISLMLWGIDYHECKEGLITTCRTLGRAHSSIRVGRIVMLPQGMQRTVNMLYESHEVSQFYQIDFIHDTFFELLK
ncbi:unnamed protein product [Caenorhabditis sp. 36 PRJEB53466]|nr:unnamed protein product [Caenorhabditis sp. 36 PRJEB53466]